MGKIIKGTQSEINLLKAFSGESQARNRYEFFAKIAKKEGYEQIADIFQQTADHEKAHASRFFKFLDEGELEITAKYPAGKRGTTIENLQLSIKEEHGEHTSLYPEFEQIARNEGLTDVAVAFRTIAMVEAFHEKRFKKLLENIENDQVFSKNEPIQWMCKKCGYIHTGENALDICPACLHPKGYFEILAENY